MSALTATGATALSGLDQLPVSVNVWRCFLQLIGGLGIMLLVVAVLPMLGLGGYQVYKAETPGPMKDSKMTPRIAETARGLWAVYFFVATLCFLAYRVAGMGWADAFMSSSGFSVEQIMEAHGHIERYLAGMIDQRRAAVRPTHRHGDGSNLCRCDPSVFDDHRADLGT